MNDEMSKARLDDLMEASKIITKLTAVISEMRSALEKIASEEIQPRATVEFIAFVDWHRKTAREVLAKYEEKL